MKNTLLFILLISIHLNSFTQNWRWIDYLQGGSANHTFYDLEISNDQQYVYGVGRYRSTATFYGQDTNVVHPYHAGSRDVFLAKIDTMGNYQWVVTDGGPSSDFAEGVATDEFDNIYVVGTTRDSAYFGNIGIHSDSGGDVFIAKYNSDGDIIWVKNWGGDTWDFAMEVECDKQGNLYMAGYQTGNFIYGSDTLTDLGYFVMKLDYNGNIIWCKGPQNLSSNSYSTIFSLEFYDNELYFGGRTRASVTFDTINVVAPTWSNMFFAKMDTSGHINWIRTGGGVYYSDCQDLVITDSSIYVAGSYAGTALFDTITVTSLASGTGGQNEFNSRDAFLAKYNRDGSSCLWIKEEKGLNIDINYNVILDKEKNIVVTGAYNEYDLYSGTSSEGDLKIIAYDSLGNYVWEMFPQGPRKAEGIIMKQDNSGNYYFGGRIKGDYIFDSNITITVVGGKFTGIIGKIYPRLNPLNDTLQACTNDSIWVSIPNQYGSPLNYNWYKNNSPISNTNDSLFTSLNNLDSIYCIISNGLITDTLFYYTTELNLPYFSLGADTTTCDFNTSVLLNSPTGYDSYLWSTNETSNSIYVSQTNQYWLTITDTNNCSAIDTISVNFVDCTGIGELESNNIIALEYIQNNNIKILTDLNNFSTKIYSFDGKLVYNSSNEYFIDLSGFKKGGYIIRVVGKETVSTKRIIIF